MATTTAERLVVDASVVSKWHLTDEDDAPHAALVLRQYVTGELGLVAPEHIRYEVPNVITVATFGRQPRLTLGAGSGGFVRVPTATDPDYHR